MTDKDRYRLLCDFEPSIPLFSQYWWLDSLVGSDGWDVVLVEKNGNIVASMPYVFKRRYGLVFIGNALLTQSLGPWIRDTGGKEATRIARQTDLLHQIIERMPKFSSFNQSWNPNQTNWLPFYWAGFSQTTRYTYVIKSISDLSIVWDGFASSYRNKVSNAQKLLSVRTDINIEEFYRVNMLTFKRQGMREPYSLELLRAHDSALSLRNKRCIFSAHDELGRIHSVLYLVWHQDTAYVHMVGEDPELRKSGAGLLLIWEAIRFSSEQLNIDRFDFEGSMIRSVERVRRDCGASQVPYFVISKTPSKLVKLGFCLSSILRI